MHATVLAFLVLDATWSLLPSTSTLLSRPEQNCGCSSDLPEDRNLPSQTGFHANAGVFFNLSFSFLETVPGTLSTVTFEKKLKKNETKVK